MFGLAVGVCGLAFVGYCVYFDNKRRNDPNFKKKLRERKCALLLEGVLALFFTFFDLELKNVPAETFSSRKLYLFE